MSLARRVFLSSGALAMMAGLFMPRRLRAEDYAEGGSVYRALRNQPSIPIRYGSSQIDLVFADGAPGVDRDKVMRWIDRAASAMTSYLGHFPVKHYGLLVVAEDSDRVGHATTWGYQGSVTRIHVGRDASDAAFDRDWILVHEIFHIALPELPRRALWLHEGCATWGEPIARAMAGQLSPDEPWRQALASMERGLPDTTEGGMDGTERWGRLYWGGAIFWLEAEIAIFRESHGKASLRDALRAINSQSGGSSASWEPDEMMAVGDKATGTTALTKLYRNWASRSVRPDLPALFRSLGVSAQASGGVAYDRTAPLATLTQRITAPTASRTVNAQSAPRLPDRIG